MKSGDMHPDPSLSRKQPFSVDTRFDQWVDKWINVLLGYEAHEVCGARGGPDIASRHLSSRAAAGARCTGFARVPDFTCPISVFVR